MARKPAPSRAPRGAARSYPQLKHVRAGIIGYGGAFNMGRRHGQSIEMTGKGSVAAICDLDPKREEVAQADFPNAVFYTDAAEMLKRVKPDLAIVILPHHLHAPVAIQCLEAGAHVVTEKPMCLTDAEAVAMIGAAKRRKRMLSVFHNRRWDGDFMALREAVVEKKLIGEVYHVEMYGGGYGEPHEWWRSYKEYSGGLFFDWGAHYLDWLLQIMPGRITGVTGFFHKLKWHKFSNEDNVEAAIRFEGGAVAHVQWSQLAMAHKERWRLLGTEGAIVSGDGKFRLSTRVKGYPAQLDVPFLESKWDAYYDNVIKHLAGSAELVVKPEQARRVIAVMDAAEQSSKAGVTVPCPSEG